MEASNTKVTNDQTAKPVDYSQGGRSTTPLTDPNKTNTTDNSTTQKKQG